MKKLIGIIIVGIGLIKISSCQHESLLTKVVDPDIPSGSSDSPCDPDSVYFVNQIQPILNSNCAFSGCHGGGSAQDGVDLTTYSKIINTGDIRPFNPGGSDLYDAITETDTRKIMPPLPRSPLTAQQITLIRKWINQGALNNRCSDCDTAMFTFSGTILPLVESNCKGCHSGSAPSGGVSLTNYSQIYAQATNGQLFGTVNHSAGFKPMPFGQSKLSQCKIDQIKKWIDAGAPNN